MSLFSHPFDLHASQVLVVGAMGFGSTGASNPVNGAPPGAALN